jgi:hypothetical protein
MWLQYLGHGSTMMILKTYSKLDWGEDLDSKRSMTRFSFLLKNGIVSWASKKQPIVALSSIEVKYMATSFANRKILWLKMLLQELGFPQKDTTIIFNDS